MNLSIEIDKTQIQVAWIRFFGAGAALIGLIALLSGCGGGGGGAEPPATFTPPPSPPPPPPVVVTPTPSEPGVGPNACVDGKAGDFDCDGIDLEARVALSAMGGANGNDIWGWTDPDGGKEYALMGLTNGAAFVDVSSPKSPRFLGRLPTETFDSVWRDIKVYRNHAYIVADQSGAHGMQIFDLTRLRDSPGDETFAPDMVYDGFTNAHNLAINEETGFAYAVATNTCGGGLHMMNIQTPNNPLFAGCHDAARTHDTQCVAYKGPDSEHRGKEICVSSNENHVEIVDVSNKSSPVALATLTYPEQSYVHQGWLTEDHRHFLLGDELDESDFFLTTRTHVFDVSDLDAPRHLYAHDLGTRATDHNLYIRGNRVYEANYRSGLRVLRLGDLANREIEEIAWFDTFPGGEESGTIGAWSVYPWLPSGTLIVSDMENGLFVLSME